MARLGGRRSFRAARQGGVASRDGVPDPLGSRAVDGRQGADPLELEPDVEAPLIAGACLLPGGTPAPARSLRTRSSGGIQLRPSRRPAGHVTCCLVTICNTNGAARQVVFELWLKCPAERFVAVCRDRWTGKAINESPWLHYLETHDLGRCIVDPLLDHGRNILVELLEERTGRARYDDHGSVLASDEAFVDRMVDE